MEMENALDIILDDIEDAFSCIKGNQSEAAKLLFDKLTQELKVMPQYKDAKEYNKVIRILELLSLVKAYDAFEGFLKVTESPAVNQNWLAIGKYFAHIISDEDQVSLLKEHMRKFPINSAGKCAVFTAIEEYYINHYKRNDLLEFYNEMVADFTVDTEFERSYNLYILFNIINNTIKFKIYKLYADLSDLLIQLIIFSKTGDNGNWFKNYFAFLHTLTPYIYAGIIEIERYIVKLRKDDDKELFQYEDLEEIGKYFFDKTVKNVKCANQDWTKAAIKHLRQYPYNQRKQPVTDEDYYKEICEYLELEEVPKKVYQQAEKQFNNIFEKGFFLLSDKITKLINDVQKEERRWSIEVEKIIAHSNSKTQILHDIEKEKSELLFYNFKIKELQTLYIENKDIKSGLLKYYQNLIDDIIKQFCEDIKNKDQVSEKLRNLSMKCAYRNTQSIASCFQPYQNSLEHFRELLETDINSVLWKNFYFVKFFPFYNSIMNKYKNYTEFGDDIISRIRNEVEKHPLFPDTMINSSLQNLAETLEKFLPDTILSVRKVLCDSICLKTRKLIIEDCLAMIEKKQTNLDELVINLLPIQMEGLFSDLLEYTMIFKCFSDIDCYKKIINAELVNKIQIAKDRHINMHISGTAYFKYYFNSIIRNTIAHGNYALLIRSKIRKDLKDEISNDLIKRILVLELVYDLNFLVQMIYDINEIDTANKYINYAYNQYTTLKENDKSDFYECMYLDLSGNRNRLNINHYKLGVFVTYNPQQLLFWIFNPYYEKFLEIDKLKAIREIVCSSEFWTYIKKEKLKSEFQWKKRDSNEPLKRIVQSMFKIIDQYDNNERLKKCLKDVMNVLNRERFY